MNDMCLKIETLLPFQGVGEKTNVLPRALPWARRKLGFQPALFHNMHKTP